MKTQLLKSFITFLIFNSTLLISAKGQIVYTDVNPDVTNYANFIYNLDLNNDGLSDFILLNSSFGPSISVPCYGCLGGGIKVRNKRISIQPIDSNNIGLNGTNSKLDSNMLINPSALSWSKLLLTLTLSHTGAHCSQYGGCHPHDGILSGNWASSASDKFIAFRIKVGTSLYYGWLQLTVSGIDFFTIKGYAYNSIPNQPILAGETSCTTPTVNLTQSGSLSFCAGDSVVLTAKGTGYLYQWKRNGVNISGATKQNYVAKTAGIYKCKVTNSCGSILSAGKTVTVPCRNSDASLNMTTDGLEHLLIYPNPATNSITIKIPSDDAGEIQIINLFGRVVETHCNASLRGNELQIDVSKYPSGMYVARWSSGENYQTQKFSVVH